MLAKRQGATSWFLLDLSDAATRFQVLVFGHTPDGRLGAATYEITSRLPVSIEPKVPLEVTSSDSITIPVAVDSTTRANGTGRRQS